MAPIRPIAPGVFFGPAAALPRGRHALSREEVVAIQRERLMIAFTELLAAQGYMATSISDVVDRAGVSRAAFYDCFADFEACATASYDRFIDVLLARVAQGLATSGDLAEWVRSVLTGYLSTLAADPVAARAFQLEMEGAGVEARRRRRDALGRFADVIATRYRELGEGGKALPQLARSAHLGTVYAVRQLACDALEDDLNPDLSGLVDDASLWIRARDLGARIIETEQRAEAD